jgi:2-keto-4-pentenoate hydratase/2-oxohepta-3-ene-1,7-dioic acid hydratase in catechol pathway
MKLIVLYNNYPATALNKEPLDVYTLPDTALLKDEKPLFIPDFADLCTVQTHLVVRICRLGRSISERFAHRYYDAITVGATFTAENLRQELAAAHRPWDLAVGFDGAAAVGRMIPLYENHPPQTNDSEAGVNQHFMPLSNDITFSLQNNGTTIHAATSGMMLNHIDKVIAKISKHYTLRQGDLIFTGTPSPAQQVNINDRITGYIGENNVLRFNIK